jgi:hypothetical protein
MPTSPMPTTKVFGRVGRGGERRHSDHGDVVHELTLMLSYPYAPLPGVTMDWLKWSVDWKKARWEPDHRHPCIKKSNANGGTRWSLCQCLAQAGPIPYVVSEPGPLTHAKTS